MKLSATLSENDINDLARYYFLDLQKHPAMPRDKFNVKDRTQIRMVTMFSKNHLNNKIERFYIADVFKVKGVVEKKFLLTHISKQALINDLVARIMFEVKASLEQTLLADTVGALVIIQKHLQRMQEREENQPSPLATKFPSAWYANKQGVQS